MKTAGIICEYNPFHSGHLYHFAKTRELLGNDCAIICAMSGNFVQRGEPAVFSKFARAKAAVVSGADLVIELPITACLSSAEGFAKGGIDLLKATGVCDHLSFGCECGDINILKSLADLSFSDDIKIHLSSGLSYADAVQACAEKLIPDKAHELKKPNNLLAVEYLKALPAEITPIAVPRIGSEHDKANSASEIRSRLYCGNTDLSVFPQSVREIFKEEIETGKGPILPLSIEKNLLYRLRTMSRDDYYKLAGGSEGLGDRLMNAASDSSNLNEILAKAKTKRYPMSRLRRLLLRAYLGLSADELSDPCEYIRVLAIGQHGRELLNMMKEKASLPVIIKPSSGLKIQSFAKYAKLDNLFSLCYPNENLHVEGEDLRTSPFIL